MRLFEGGIIAAVLLFLAANQGIAPPKEMPDLIESPADCTAHLPWGKPEVPGQIQVICKAGYTSFFDTNQKIPRLVAYREKGNDTFGCLDRMRDFHTERTLPDGRPSPGDYKNSGYDMGHQAPDQDMASSYVRLFDSYNLANVAPQLPELNRQGWESLEEDVRSWTFQRGEVVVYVGSIVSDTPKTIGRNQIVVPDAFYKIIIDPKTNESIGFIMPNAPVLKNQEGGYEVPISDIEKETKISFPLPGGTDHNANPPFWQTDVAKWRLEHKTMCTAAKWK